MSCSTTCYTRPVVKNWGGGELNVEGCAQRLSPVMVLLVGSLNCVGDSQEQKSPTPHVTSDRTPASSFPMGGRSFEGETLGAPAGTAGLAWKVGGWLALEVGLRLPKLTLAPPLRLNRSAGGGAGVGENTNCGTGSAHAWGSRPWWLTQRGRAARGPVIPIHRARA